MSPIAEYFTASKLIGGCSVDNAVFRISQIPDAFSVLFFHAMKMMSQFSRGFVDTSLMLLDESTRFLFYGFFHGILKALFVSLNLFRFCHFF